MEVITSHVNLDFDGFASMIAAKKLYPNAQLVLPNVISKDVRDFLILYRSFFELKEFREINVSEITKLIVVDTSSFNRVIDFKEVLNNKDIPKIVFDHHSEEDNTIDADYCEIKKYGSCTSIMLKKIMEQGIEVRPLESTVLAIGIYTDTNCLTFSSTTVEDAKAVAFLLECGAYLDVISNFIGQPLSTKQKDAFEEFVKNIESYNIKGFEIAVTTAIFDEYVDEIAYITHKILSLNEYDAVISIAFIGNKSYIVGRSITKKINMHHVMKELNGSGHIKAGSAKVKGMNLDEVKEKVLEILNDIVEPSITAKDIASFPVKTISQDAPLDEVDKILLRYGHSGLPVIKDDNVVGMITRRDIEKAIHHGFGHSPVKAYMSKKFFFIEHNATIKEIQHKFIEYNIGRLPVFENGKLIGIVTRTDILRQIFGEDSPSSFKQIFIEEKDRRYKRDFSQELDNLEEEIKQILKTAGRLGDKRRSNVYVVGGFVRDLLIGRKNLDIDIVVVGDGVQLAKELSAEYNGKIKIHEKFQTSVVEISRKYKIDIVTARREFYEFPAALPTIEKGSIKSDLYRRDFTINSMAICLNEKHYGKLIDYFGGQRDLQQGIVRVLYNMSFIEDPTRIFRAIRFVSRFHFKLEEETNRFMMDAIDADFLEKVSNERITDELMLILKEVNAYEAILQLIQMGIFRKIYSTLNIDDKVLLLIKNVCELDKLKNLDLKLLYVTALFVSTTFDETIHILDKLKLSKHYKNTIISFVKNNSKIISTLSKSRVDNYRIYINLSKLSNEELFLLKLLSNEIVSQRIDLYNNKLKNIKLLINGQKLKELGITSGPNYKDIFRKVFEAKLNNKIDTIEDEIDYVKQITK